ncbi:hypothetical protein Ccrd_002204, partial [Cynara cardunculus var. scolymus]
MANVSRIHRELMQFNKDQSILGMSLMPDDQDIRHLTATIPGPLSTPYEGGIFHLDITLPDGYPFEPPKMRHPNISSQTGAICLDILKNNWSPALNLKTALISLQALLSSPEPNDPQDAVVAKQVQKLVEMGFPEPLVKKTLEAVGGDESMALERLRRSWEFVEFSDH